MQQTTIAPENLAPPQTTSAEGAFAYRSKSQLVARRALLRTGYGAADTLEPDYFQAAFNLPVGEARMLSEFSPEFQDERQANFQSHVNSLAVFAWNSNEEISDKNDNAESSHPEVAHSDNLMVVTTKLRELFKKQKSADRLYGSFLRLFSQDIGVSAHESSWLKAAEQDPELLQFGDDTLPIDSLAARISYVYTNKPYEAQKNAVNNSRLRGERFVQQHGETIKNAIEAFPDLAKQVLADHGITDEQALAAIQKRFNEAKDRVVVTSYLEGLMPGDAIGAYLGSSHALLINADMLVDAAKEEVEHVVFHELWHAVSSQNNADCREAGSEESVKRSMGTGIPHARWLREGGTELLARDTMRKRYDGKVDISGMYDHEVGLVANIIDANPTIKALLLEGNFEDMSAGQKPGELKTSRAVALIEKVYGPGFVEHVEQTLNSYRKEPEKDKSKKLATEIKHFKNYTKNPKLARKALRVAATSVAVLGGGAGLALGAAGPARSALEQYFPPEAESRPTYVWQDTTPEQIESVVALNTQQGTDVGAVYIKDGYVEVMDDGLRTGHYDNPIYFEDSAGEAYAGFMSGGQFTVKKLGLQDDGDSVLIMIPEENSAVVAVPVIEEGRLVDRESGQELGSDAFELIEPASSP